MYTVCHMATPGTVTLLPFTEGDTWEGIPSVKIGLKNGDPMPTDLVLVKMQFRRDPQSQTVGGRLNSETGGGIFITSASDWEFNIPSRPMRLLTQGTWLWDIQTTDDSGNITTYIKGTIEVLPQITR